MLTNKHHFDISNLNIPESCPVCQGDLEILSNGKVKCINPNCKQKVAHKLLGMFVILEVRGAGPAYVENAIQDCSDLTSFFSQYKTKSESWAGGVNGTKFVKKLDKALQKPISLAKFLACFDIDGIAEGQIAKVIKAKNADLNFFLEAKDSKIFECEGIRESLATKMFDGIQAVKQEILDCKQYFSFEKDSKVEKVSGKFTGMSFCFTGKAVLPRKDLERITTENGGVISAVKKGLTYLVTDDTESGSSKNRKAAELGIPVITSTAFLQLSKD